MRSKLNAGDEKFTQQLTVINTLLKELLHYKYNPQSFPKMLNPFLVNTTKVLFDRVFFGLVDFIFDHDIAKFRELFVDYFKAILKHGPIEEWSKLDNLFEAISMRTRNFILEEINQWIDYLGQSSREYFSGKMQGYLTNNSVFELRFAKQLNKSMTTGFDSYADYWWYQLIDSLSADNFLSAAGQADFIDLLLELDRSRRKLSIDSITTFLQASYQINDLNHPLGQKMRNSIVQMHYRLNSQQLKDSIAALEILPESKRKFGLHENQQSPHAKIFEIVSTLCNFISDVVSNEYQKKNVLAVTGSSRVKMLLGNEENRPTADLKNSMRKTRLRLFDASFAESETRSYSYFDCAK